MATELSLVSLKSSPGGGAMTSGLTPPPPVSPESEYRAVECFVLSNLRRATQRVYRVLPNHVGNSVVVVSPSFLAAKHNARSLGA